MSMTKLNVNDVDLINFKVCPGADVTLVPANITLDWKIPLIPIPKELL